MFRFALNYLESWLKDKFRKPLVIRGARQVGKTWVVRELAKTSNLELIEINFELDPNKKELFKENKPEKVLQSLEASFNKKINLNKTLLFLDEIQEFPFILAKLRWFKELMPELAVIVAGSLLEFVLDEHTFSMPVGRISYFHLEPLSFDEFLYTKNKQMLKFLNEYEMDTEIPSPIHDKILEYLKEYIIVGGLPASVVAWLETNSLTCINQVQHDILTTYRDDFVRYKGRYNLQFFDYVFNYIPKNVGNKVVYSHIDKKSQVASLKKIFTLIAKSGVIHKIQTSHGNGIPLAAEITNHNKAISLDVGIMNSILGTNLYDFKSASHIDFINEGSIAEQVAGQLLRTIEPYYIEPKLYYWQRNKPGSNAEIDYLIQHNSTVIPIEVKAGTKGSMQSLHLFMKLKSLSKAVLLNSNPPSKMMINTKLSNGEEVQYELLSLPIYMVGQLKRLLDR